MKRAPVFEASRVTCERKDLAALVPLLCSPAEIATLEKASSLASLVRVAKARALADGRDYLAPDDVKAIAEPVLAHRLIVAPEARAAGTTSADLVRDALDKTPVPV